jgi:hypothetical protein
MIAMDPLTLLLANQATRNGLRGSQPTNHPRRRPAKRADRVR